MKIPENRLNEAFGDVNVLPQANGTIDLVASLKLEVNIEGMKTGLALDASRSMKEMYGTSIGPFGAAKSNVVETVARGMGHFLATRSVEGKVHIIYWAIAPAGDQIEELGVFDEQQSLKASISGPKKYVFGGGTKLSPAVDFFVNNKFKDAKWAIVVFITDGIIEDLDEVKKLCMTFAKEIAAGNRNFIKLVLIGVGAEVDEEQMEELDDMFEGSGLLTPQGDEIDLWDHKLAATMETLESIFSEVVQGALDLSGSVKDHKGKVIVSYSDTIPAVLRFTLPGDATSFTLEVGGKSYKQDISDIN